jgi:hypothetical protein
MENATSMSFVLKGDGVTQIQSPHDRNLDRGLQTMRKKKMKKEDR